VSCRIEDVNGDGKSESITFIGFNDKPIKMLVEAFDGKYVLPP